MPCALGDEEGEVNDIFMEASGLWGALEAPWWSPWEESRAVLQLLWREGQSRASPPLALILTLDMKATAQSLTHPSRSEGTQILPLFLHRFVGSLSTNPRGYRVAAMIWGIVSLRIVLYFL